MDKKTLHMVFAYIEQLSEASAGTKIEYMGKVWVKMNPKGCLCGSYIEDLYCNTETGEVRHPSRLIAGYRR